MRLLPCWPKRRQFFGEELYSAFVHQIELSGTAEALDDDNGAPFPSGIRGGPGQLRWMTDAGNMLVIVVNV
jgi:hypothetical protein